MRQAVPEARVPPSLVLERTARYQVFFCSHLPTVDLLEEQVEAQFGCIVLRMNGAMDRKAQDVATNTFQEDPWVQSAPRPVVGSGGIQRQSPLPEGEI